MEYKSFHGNPLLDLGGIRLSSVVQSSDALEWRKVESADCVQSTGIIIFILMI